MGCPHFEVVVVQDCSVVPTPVDRARPSVEFGTQLGDDLGLAGCLGDGQRGVLEARLVLGVLGAGVGCAAARCGAGGVVEVQWLCGRDVDGRGEQLLMGSTTGSLWYSGDGGESFVPVSGNLPPIHSVRFAR